MKQNEKPGLLYKIPMIWNGLTAIVFLVVAVTFFIGSRQPSTAEVQLPGIILIFFTLFDILLAISPLTLIVTVLISVVNCLKTKTSKYRFIPLIFSVIMQGALTALLLSSAMGSAA